MKSFLEELHRRGMIQDVSDEQGLYSHLGQGPAKAYIGFDPTSTSLTVGNLLPIMMLRLFQECGHRPVVLCGGGTGLVGDPSGKSLERPLLDEADVRYNVDAQLQIFRKLLDFDSPNGAVLINNLDWLGDLGYLQALREAGKHLSVFAMFKKESVQSRQETGMSYAEFSYQFLQAFDFAYLHEHHGVTIQMGGSDQWGNITTGLELIRKMSKNKAPSYGVTSSLLLDRSGVKMGKSTRGAIWMSADKTSPYDLYQYYLNLSDEAAVALVPRLIMDPGVDVTDLMRAAQDTPSERLAQRALADMVTTLLYGTETSSLCESSSRIMFTGRVAELSKIELDVVFASIPAWTVQKSRLTPELRLADLLVTAKVVPSKSEARRLARGGGISINGRVVSDMDSPVVAWELMHDAYLAVRKGAKTWHLVKFV